jgi:hypothetical protein
MMHRPLLQTTQTPTQLHSRHDAPKTSPQSSLRTPNGRMPQTVFFTMYNIFTNYECIFSTENQMHRLPYEG